MNRVLLVSLTALILPLARVQAQVTPLRRSASTEKISFFQLTPVGDLRVGTKNEVVAPDSERGETKWTRDDFVRFQPGREQRPGLELVPVVTVAGAMAGAGGILAARLFYLGFLMVAPCDRPCEVNASRAFEHFPKYESIGAAIGVGAGFVLGVVLYSLEQRRQGGAGGKERRVSATVVPQRDGRFGFGTSVRF